MLRNVIVLNHSRKEWAVLPREIRDPFAFVRSSAWNVNRDMIECVHAKSAWVDPTNATRLSRGIEFEWTEVTLSETALAVDPPQVHRALWIGLFLMWTLGIWVTAAYRGVCDN
jgi:hypothetical protein